MCFKRARRVSVLSNGSGFSLCERAPLSAEKNFQPLIPGRSVSSLKKKCKGTVQGVKNKPGEETDICRNKNHIMYRIVG
jgi:hypothetical protein